VQKLVRAAFGTNNVDTCAACLSFAHGLRAQTHAGESAGTQEFVSVQHADVDHGHRCESDRGASVFASQMKRRLRAGRRLIVIDPRAIALVKSPHVEADYHLRLLPARTSQSSMRWRTSW
jgi:formate dehydrogenase major subunit